jgi:hypothetical protein
VAAVDCQRPPEIGPIEREITWVKIPLKVGLIPNSVVRLKGTGGNAGAPRYLERRKLVRVFDRLPASPFEEGPVFCAA